MKRRLKNTNGYEDPKVNSLARDTQAGFDSISDITKHKVTIVWNGSFSLLVPYFGGDLRLKSPEIVRCGRAKNLTDPTILVTPGGVSFEWIGDGQVRIDAVHGLTLGHKYELVFEAVD